MVKINNLASEIIKELEKYSSLVDDDLSKATDEVSKAAVSELKSNSPVRTGKYARNWSRKKTMHGYTVYNKAPTYRLTHLLERGHMNRDGSYTRPRVHIKPVENKVIEEMTSKAEEAAKQ